MAPPTRPRRLPALFAGLLLVAFFIQSLSASRLKSPTFDENVHIGAGLSYVATGVFRANPQHPPLLKELAGLSLLAAGIRWPDTWTSRQLIAGGSLQLLEAPVGNSIIARGGPDRVMLWARLPLVIIATFLGLLIFLWGREIAGDWAALGALFLYSLDPTILAHSALVTTDVGFAAFAILFLFALYKFQRRPTFFRLLVCGLSLGAALCTKFSAVFLLVIAAVLMRAALKWPAEPDARPPHPWLDTCAGNGIGKKTILVFAGSFLVMCLIAALVVDACYLSPRGLSLYVRGMATVNVDHDPNFLVFMAGHVAHRFAAYFAVAYLLKEPIASIVLVSIGVAIVLRSRKIPVLTKLYLFVPPAILFASYVLGADDIGIRYIIPVMPFAYLFGGTALAALSHGRRWQQGLGVVLCGWLILAAAGIYPDHLSYFNEAACLLRNPSQIGLDGGTRCGPLWLDDSNVDWGQGLKQLSAWADQNVRGQTFRMFYFGSFPPQFYGIHYEPMDISKVAANPTPGLYVISAHLIGFLPALGDHDHSGDGEWLRSTPPDAIVGHALYVYKIPPGLMGGKSGRVQPEPPTAAAR